MREGRDVYVKPLEHNLSRQWQYTTAVLGAEIRPGCAVGPSTTAFFYVLFPLDTACHVTVSPFYWLILLELLSTERISVKTFAVVYHKEAAHTMRFYMAIMTGYVSST